MLNTHFKTLLFLAVVGISTTSFAQLPDPMPELLEVQWDVQWKAAEFKAFETDGCSAFPDGTFTNPTLWRHCCITHDLRYWIGGPREQRRAANKELLRCVNTVLGHEDPDKTLSKGTLMYLGVLIGGSGKINSPWRWGYGWPYSFDSNKALSASQKEQAIRGLTLWLIYSFQETAADDLEIEVFHLNEIRKAAFQQLSELSQNRVQDSISVSEESLVSDQDELYD